MKTAEEWAEEEVKRLRELGNDVAADGLKLFYVNKYRAIQHDALTQAALLVVNGPQNPMTDCLSAKARIEKFRDENLKLKL